MLLFPAKKFLFVSVLFTLFCSLPLGAEVRRSSLKGQLNFISATDAQISSMFSSEKRLENNSSPILKVKGFALPLGSFEAIFITSEISDWKAYADNGRFVEEIKQPKVVSLSGLVKSRAFGASGKKRTTRTVSVPAAGQLKRLKNGKVSLVLSFSFKGLFSRRFYQAELSSIEPGRDFRMESSPAQALHSKTCGTEHKGESDMALWAEQALSGITPQTFAQPAPVSLNREVEIVTDCDSLCLQNMGGSIGTANAKIAQMVNTANAIYARQFGITFKILAQVVRTSESPYPSSITDSGALLNEFHNQSAALRNADMKHLVTGRVMDSHVIGLGYSSCGGTVYGVTCLCPDFSQSLSVYLNDTLSSVIMAHELGHNLGASHDPAGQGIMSSVLSNSSEALFSSFSHSQIARFVKDFGFLCLSEQDAAGSNSAIVNETPDSSDMEASLSVRFRNGSLTASVSLPEAPADVVCVVDLQGSSTMSGLEGGGKTLAYAELSGNSRRFTARKIPYLSRRAKSASKPVWFGANIVCEDSTSYQASPVSLKVMAARSWRGATVKSASSWIKYIEGRFR